MTTKSKNSSGTLSSKNGKTSPCKILIFSKPSRLALLKTVPMPERYTSAPKTVISGDDLARWIVVSPEPKPISKAMTLLVRKVSSSKLSSIRYLSLKLLKASF